MLRCLLAHIYNQDLNSNWPQRSPFRDNTYTPSSTSTPSPSHQVEQVWLVPVRTARSILGVLRVTVMIPANTRKFHDNGIKGEKLQSRFRSSITPNTSIQISPYNSIKGKNSYSHGNIEDITIRGMSSFRDAQNSIINFSELLAPLLSAASHVDALKTTMYEKTSIRYEQDPKSILEFAGM
jgi:hypothetical protein